MGKLLWMSIYIFFFSLLVRETPASLQGLKSLKQGSSLSVEQENDYLLSPNGTFSTGFYQVGINAYCFAIWFANSADRTVVWMANRDQPVNGKRSKLHLNRAGNLILRDANGTAVWETKTYSQAPVLAQLLETGNLVVVNTKGEIIWQSFNSPTNTLLPTQMFTKSMTLVSMTSKNTFFKGYYILHFRDDNALALVYNGPQFSSVYWPNPDLTIFQNKRTTYNSSRVAILNEKGRFVSSDNLKFNAADIGLGPKRRLTLDFDGILRLYSLDDHTGLWNISWSANLDTCRVHGLCGAYGICHYTPEPACRCPPGFRMADPSDWSKGCLPNFNSTCNPSETEFLELYNTDYYGYELETWANNISFEACRNTCLHDCRCVGFAYSIFGDGRCFPKWTLLNGFQMPTANRSMHIRVPKHATFHGSPMKLNASDMDCSGSRIVSGSQVGGFNQGNDGYLKYLIGFVAVIGTVEMVCIGLAWWFIHKTNKNVKAIDMGYLALVMGFRRFSYAELKTATRNFRKEIGSGGFGKVYKGALDDGRIVAVKRLEGILQGEEEFWAEVSIIGRINHMNLVKMLGFCTEEKHKLLVYEYLENGSLDKVLFSASSGQLEWTKRFDIALGTAKGLSYLHEECLEWVLHCDVKPQNILLDNHFQPKVADFGMSKLFQKNGQHSFSRVRGTRGYLAPEWMRNLYINAKADVYSYGIVLLELISGKCATNFSSGQHQENECGGLADWVKEKLSTQEGMKEVVDPRLNGDYSIKEFKKLATVALLCVQEDRDKRPAMSEVVKLLLSTDDDDGHNSRGNE